MSHIRTFNLHREDTQFPQLLLVVLSQEAQSLGCLSGDVESDTHAVPRLHTLGFELVSTFIRQSGVQEKYKPKEMGEKKHLKTP